jgi:hypothetical protein
MCVVEIENILVAMEGVTDPGEMQMILLGFVSDAEQYATLEEPP